MATPAQPVSRRIRAAGLPACEDNLRSFYRIAGQPQSTGKVIAAAGRQNANRNFGQIRNGLQQNLKCAVAAQRKDPFPAALCLLLCYLSERRGTFGASKVGIPMAFHCESREPRQRILCQTAAGDRVREH